MLNDIIVVMTVTFHTFLTLTFPSA